MTPIGENYVKACNDYLQAFCQKHDFDYPRACERWVADEVGEIAIVGDYFVSMRDIITDIEEDVPEEKFLQYYDWCLEDGHNWNYKTWLRNQNPEKILEDEKRLVELSERIKELKKQFLDEDCPYYDDCPF